MAAPKHRLPPLRLFSVFEAVLRLGSLSRAAQELNVSQPAISQAIRLLEDHAGQPLFDRSRRPLAPTEAGAILGRAVEDGLGRISDALMQLRLMQRGAQGAVTVACSVGTATYWLMPGLARFYQRHPEISVNVMTTTNGAPALTPGIDLALRYGRGDWQDGQVTRLFGESVVPVCAPALMQGVRAKGVGDKALLAQHPLLHVESQEASWLGWPDYLRAFALPRPDRAGRHFTNYVQATQAAVDGQGILLGWSSNTRDLVARGQLVALDLPRLTPKDAFFMVMAPARLGHPAVEALARWLAQAS